MTILFLQSVSCNAEMDDAILAEDLNPKLVDVGGVLVPAVDSSVCVLPDRDPKFIAMQHNFIRNM